MCRTNENELTIRESLSDFLQKRNVDFLLQISHKTDSFTRPHLEIIKFRIVEWLSD